MSWEVVFPPPARPDAVPALSPAGAVAPTMAPVGAMRPVSVAVEHVVPQLTLTALVDAAELLLFRSDLGCPLAGVVVAAAGRALARHLDLNVTVTERGGAPAVVPLAGTSVRLALLGDDGLHAPAVVGAGTASLTDVRDEVARIVEDARLGRPPAPAGPAALRVNAFALAGVSSAPGITLPESCALAVGPLDGAVPVLPVALTVDARVIDADQASRFLATLVRLLEHPYRRLV